MSYDHQSEADLRELYIEKDMTQTEIAEKLDISPSAISRWINRHGIETGNSGWHKESNSNLLEHYGEDKSFNEMAEGTKYTPGQIRYAAIEEGVYIPEEEVTYSKEDLLEQINTVYGDHGRVSRTLFNESDSTASVSVVDRKFESWCDAVEAAGLDPDRSTSTNYEKDEVVEQFNAYIAEGGKVQLAAFLQSEYGPNSEMAIRNKFDGFKQLLDESTLSKTEYPPGQMSNKTLINLLQEHEGTSRTSIRENPDLPPVSTYEYRFGSVKRACEKANIEYNRANVYSEEEIKEKIADIANEETVSAEKLSESSITHGPIKRITNEDSIADAIESLGYKYEGHKNKYTETDLIDEMKRCNDKHGDVKVGYFKRDDSLPSWLTYVVRFGSWAEAKKAAGFEPGNGRPPEAGENTYQYGPEFYSKRPAVRERDGNKCQVCEITERELDRSLDVHHIKPVREFDDPSNAHTMDNMISLCHDCHMSVEAGNTECPDPPTEI